MHTCRVIVFASLGALLLAGCLVPQTLPAGPTPIPTLAPATEIRPSIGTQVPSFAIQSYPARPPSAALGQPLYQAHCSRCHGTDGKGVVPGARNFSDLDFMRGETPASFYAAVTEGRGDMPAFRESLSSDARWDVAFYVWRFSTDTTRLALGTSLYAANCAACHGDDGTGKVLGAADFTDLRLVDTRAPRDYYLTVTQGRGSMPAWQARLSQDERWAVIDYLRTFSYEPFLPGEVALEPPALPTTALAACDPSYLSQTNPFAWEDAAALAAGQETYGQACAVCHGADGTGNLPGIPDLTASEFQGDLRASGGEYLCTVAEGRGSMPGWKETLGLEQMWQVLTYIGSLGR